jgi:hypothetical protein
VERREPAELAVAGPSPDSGAVYESGVTTEYNTTTRTTYLWGDAALDAGEANLVTGTPMGEFHTFRFEVRDGQSSIRWADGKLLATFQTTWVTGRRTFSSVATAAARSAARMAWDTQE